MLNLSLLRRHLPLARCALLALFNWGTGCDDQSPPGDLLPEGWAGAVALPLIQSACAGDPYTTPPRPRLELAASGAGLVGVYREAQFRCGNQQLCGFLAESAAVSRVLVQPCDLHPDNVTRCDCLYDVMFTLAPRPERTSVELHSRRDLYGATGPVAPRLVSVEPVRGSASGIDAAVTSSGSTR